MKRYRIKKCMAALSQAGTYGEWRDIAEELDELMGNNAWRADDRSSFYNFAMVRRDMEQMQAFRESANVYRLLDLLHDSLRRNLGDLAHPKLYEGALSGTKYLIEQYLDEAQRGLEFLCNNDFPLLPHDKKLRLFTQAAKVFGRSALMLSGGSTFGLFHMGVVRALVEQDLLPDIISGSSMGAIVAAGTCTRTDSEILALHYNARQMLSRKAFRLLHPRDWWREKSIMDQKTLLRLIRANVGDYTFAEAYERTGRVLNISVSPTRTGLKPRVLNYITAPNVMIPYAALASSAVPGLFPPSKLMAKDKVGDTIPYMANEKWVDGSVHGDLPMQRLARLHNVNHTIVSQTNPHVIPFIGYRQRHGLLPLAADMAASAVQAQVLQVIKVARRRVQINPWRLFLDQAHAIAGQQYTGDINVNLPFSPLMYRKLLANPTIEDMERFVMAGQRAIWPKIAMIRNQTRITRVFASCLARLKPDSKTIEARPL